MVNFTCVSSVLNLAAEFGVQELLGTVSSSKLSSHQMPIRGFMGVQKVIASLISSELSSHQMAIRGEPGSSGSPPASALIQTELSAYLGRLDASTEDCIHTLRVPVPSGEFPPPGTCPYCASPFFPPLVSRSWYLYV